MVWERWKGCCKGTMVGYVGFILISGDVLCAVDECFFEQKIKARPHEEDESIYEDDRMIKLRGRESRVKESRESESAAADSIIPTSY
eukprot:scaffold14652_cov97-Skeletonema_dohrnii-CCMP3373.AAC.2